MAGVHLEGVAERGDLGERVEQVLGAFTRGDREVGPRGVADEERVAGEDELVVDDERAVLGTMARRVEHADPH